MIYNNINIKPEERCGYYVTSDVKKLWSVELDLLEQLKKICTKHDINYFAAGGTLLGAVRHKGFIPWDDDIDIYMDAQDYERFCQIASDELQPPYYLQIMHSMARIRNSLTTAVTSGDLQKLKLDKNYNCGIFIDIFPLHYVYDNKLLRLVHKFRLRILERVGAGYTKNGLLKNNPRKYWKFYFSKAVALWKLFNLFYDYDEYLSIYKREFAKCEKSTLVGQISLFGLLQDKYIYNKQWYDLALDFPFENTTIRVPKEYDLILKKAYGDYMVYKKGTAVHTMEFFDAEVPYKEKLKNM